MAQCNSADLSLNHWELIRNKKPYGTREEYSTAFEMCAPVGSVTFIAFILQFVFPVFNPEPWQVNSFLMGSSLLFAVKVL